MSLKNPVTTVETILMRAASVAAAWLIEGASERPSKFSWLATNSCRPNPSGSFNNYVGWVACHLTNTLSRFRV